MRRRYHRNAGISHAHHGVLESANGKIQFVVILFNGHHENHSDIGASREILTGIGYNETFVGLLGNVNSFIQAFDNAAANGIHFGVEFEVQNAMTKVNQSSICVFPNHIFITQSIQVHFVFRTWNYLVGLRRNVEKITFSAFKLVESGDSFVAHGVNPIGQFFAFFLRNFDSRFNADGIPHFKRTQFPSKTSAHGIVDFVEFIRDFWNAMRNISKQSSACFTIKCARFVHAVEEHFHTLTQIFNGLGHFQSWEFHLLLGFIFHRL